MRHLKILSPYLLVALIVVAVLASNLPSDLAREEPSRTRPLCPSCGMEVDRSTAPSHGIGADDLHFCGLACRDTFVAGSEPPSRDVCSDAKRHLDVVCQMEVNPGWGISSEHDGEAYHFCTKRCKELFDAAPEEYLASSCIVCKAPLADTSPCTATYLGKPYLLCSDAHRAQFKEDPAAYFMHTMWGIPPWLYQGSVAMVLLVSFGLFDRLGRRTKGSAQPGDGPWRSPPGDQNRFDLFSVGWIRAAFSSRLFRFTVQLAVVGPFLLIIAAGLLGNQNPAFNIAPLLTWTIWWALLPLLILFAGKFWCYACPWDAVAGWIEKLRFWRKSDDGLSLRLPWPRIVRNIAIATILFVGLTWVELGFGVTLKPRVTAYLAIAMLLLAVISSMLFDRKSFCRYGCLVGRVSGLYAMFAGIEVRPRNSSACTACGTKECVKGSATAYGCPTFLHPGKLEVNTYCIQCMECVQACPHDNLALNLRPLGSDLAVEGRPRKDEAYLALLMLSITGFHGLTMTPVWQEMVDGIRSSAGWGRILGFSAGMVLVMLLPVLVYAALVAISQRVGARHAPKPPTYKDYFIRYAYALLPIAIFYHLAHNLEHLLMEGPKILALISDPFGWSWNLFGTAGWNVPPLISLDKLWLLQVALVLIGHVVSLWTAQKTSLRLFGSPRAAFRSQIPMLAGMILFSIFSLWLLKQPMEMRTSAM